DAVQPGAAVGDHGAHVAVDAQPEARALDLLLGVVVQADDDALARAGDVLDATGERAELDPRVADLARAAPAVHSGQLAGGIVGAGERGHVGLDHLVRRAVELDLAVGDPDA